MAVDIALDGAAALRRAAVYDYDVIVLDRDLPGVHGDRVCETLVEQGGPRARVLMLTASAGIEDRVAGPQPRRRRLPAQAVRVRRAGRAHPGARAARPAGARRR